MCPLLAYTNPTNLDKNHIFVVGFFIDSIYIFYVNNHVNSNFFSDLYEFSLTLPYSLARTSGTVFEY